MKKIMLVDDVDISNFIMKKMIAKATPQHQVFDFILPQKALDSLEQINPDIIFLDLNMPLIDGWKFLDIMKEKGFGNKVLILTSSTSEMDKQRSLAYSNVLSFLIKPIPPNAIADIIESV
jgi:two-component system nitrate/nitrite response regulator NarL